MEYFWADIMNFAPLSNGFCLAFMGNESVSSTISRLLFRRSPAAILRRVISPVLSAIKSFSLWALTHVSEKVLKRVPSFTESYTLAPVVRESIIVRIITPRTHASPSAIGRCCAIVRSSTVFFEGARPALSGFTGNQVIRKRVCNVSANTFTFPGIASILFSGRSADDGQFAEGLTREIRNGPWPNSLPFLNTATTTACSPGGKIRSARVCDSATLTSTFPGAHAPLCLEVGSFKNGQFAENLAREVI